MKILIDLVHMADLNFFKYAVEELVKDGHTVVFTVLRRGRLVPVARQEFAGFEIIPLGRHRKSFFGKVFGIVSREAGFFRLFLSRRFDVVSSFGFYPGFFGRLFGAKAVHFHDDKEYRLNFFLSRLFASRFIALCPVRKSRKVRVADSFKELAALHPSRARFDDAVLKKLGLRKGKYVYVRDISRASLNYASHVGVDYQPFFDTVLKKGFKVVYNAESEENPYKGVIPIVSSYSYEQITSLKKHAALVVSSGDTELRESALLGVPCVYTAGRVMAVNKPLFDAGLFVVAKSSKELLKKGLSLLGKNHEKKSEKFIKGYADMTSIIVEELTR